MSGLAKPAEPSSFRLFGREVLCGLVRIVMEEAEILDVQAIKSEFLSAAPGAEIPIRLRSVSGVRLELVEQRPPTGDPQSPPH